jgi:hypothetical protein
MRVNGKEYVTMELMVKKSGKTANTIKQWFFNHNIKPVSREALYELSVLDALLAADSPGRPKKEPAAKSAKKTGITP